MFSVIISLCGKLFQYWNSISERWPILRWPFYLRDNSGVVGLSLRERAALECGKAQNVCVCVCVCVCVF